MVFVVAENMYIYTFCCCGPSDIIDIGSIWFGGIEIGEAIGIDGEDTCWWPLGVFTFFDTSVDDALGFIFILNPRPGLGNICGSMGVSNCGEGGANSAKHWYLMEKD